MSNMSDFSFKKMQMALLFVGFFLYFFASAGQAQPSAGFHVIVDTQTLSSLKNDTTTQLDVLRTIGGVLPQDLPIQMWRYQGNLSALKPNYVIDAKRKAPPSATSAQQSAKSASLLESIAALADQIKPTDGTQDILLITGDNASDANLTSPLVEKMISKLLTNKIRFSTLAVTNQTELSLYELLAHATHGKVTYLSEEDSLATHFFDFLDRYSALNYAPLEDTLLKIDSHINEVTVLLFKNSGEDKEIEIIPPLGKPFTARDAPQSVTWLQNPYFDAINITNPSVGTWQIYGEEHPQSRVIIRTDFQLTGNFFPDLIAAASFQNLELSLKQKGKIVADPEVMNLVIVKAVQLQNNLEQYTWYPADNGKNGDEAAKDGLFSLPLRDTLGSGDYLIKITASSAKFQREIHRYISATDQIAWLHHESNADSNAQKILIVPFSQLIKPESIIMNASVKNEHSVTSYVEISPINQYSWELTADEGNTVVVNLAGTSYAGDTTSIWLPEIALTKEGTVDEPQDKSLTEIISNVLNLSEEDTSSHEEPVQAPLAVEDTEPHQVTLFSIGLHLTTANFVVFVLGFALYKQWQQREVAWQQNLRDRLS